MNRTVRLAKLFSASFPSVPWQQGTGQQGWYTCGILGKQLTKPTVHFILSLSNH